VGQFVFMGLILLVNIAAMVLSLYQSYRARNLPTDFNESYYVSVSTFSLLESLILGGPLLLLVHDNPSADFLIKTVLVTIVCSTILLCMFVPKYLQRNLREMRTDQSHGQKRRRAAARITTINRHSAFSQQPGGRSSSSCVNSSLVVGRGSVGRSSVESRGSVVNRGSLEASQKMLGQSTILRNEDYFLQRRSTETSRRTKILRLLQGADEQAARGSASRVDQPTMDSRHSTPTASASSSLKSKTSPPSLDGGSGRKSFNIAAFDAPPAKLQLPFDAIRESAGTERSTAESSAGGELKVAAVDHA